MESRKGACATWFLGFAVLVGVAAYVLTSTDIGKKYARKWFSGPASKDQTLAYWNGIKDNYLTQAVNTSAAKSKDFQFIANSCREFAHKIESLPTDGVDADALECGEGFVEVLEAAAKLFDKAHASSQNPMLVLQLFADPKAAVGNLAGDVQEVRKMAEQLKDKSLAVEKLAHRVRTDLSKRYAAEFPRVMPPVVVLLDPYLVSRGYYVVVASTSSFESVSVTVEYRSPGGSTRTQYTGALSAGKPAKLDPDDVDWTLESGDTITVSCDGYKHTYRVDDLKPQ